MQATSTPKLADQRPATHAPLVAVLLAAALAVGGAFGIAIRQSAPAAPAAVAGDHEASGLRNSAVGAPSDRFLDGAAFRSPQSGADQTQKVGRNPR